MENLEFVLGASTVVLLALLVATGWALLKISRLEGELLQQKLERERDLRVWSDQREEDQEWCKRHLEAGSRDVTMVERTLMGQIDQLREQVNRRIDETAHQQHEREHHLLKKIEESMSYTDSRVDRVLLKMEPTK